MKNLKDLKTALLFRTSRALDALTDNTVQGLNTFLRIVTRVHDQVDDALTAPDAPTKPGGDVLQRIPPQPVEVPLVVTNNPEGLVLPSPAPGAPQTFPKIVGSDQFYFTIREECLIVETIIRKHIHALCEALKINPVSLPIIIIVPSTYVFEGIQPEPAGACVRVSDEGVVTQIRIAGIRLEGMVVEDEDGEETFGFFQKGSEPYVRALLESLGTQLVHILHDNTRTPDMAWDAAERVAYRVAAEAVSKVLGPPPEGWMLAAMDDDNEFGEN